MNRKKAKAILLKQKSKLTDINYYNDENQVFQTGSYIKDLFGENSTEYNFISRFTFTIKVMSNTTVDERRQLLIEKEESAIKFIDNCIETIENKGLYKSEKVNFLKSLDNSTLIGVIIFFGSTIFAIGYYFGTEKINVENIELKRDNEILKDSINQKNKYILDFYKDSTSFKNK